MLMKPITAVIKKLLNIELNVMDYHDILKLVCHWLGIDKDYNFLHKMVDFIRIDDSINRYLFKQFLKKNNTNIDVAE